MMSKKLKKFFNPINISFIVILYVLIVLLISNISPKVNFIATLIVVYGSLIFVIYEIFKYKKI